jgi:peptidoglycan hydrolase CwlO-like protein
MLTLVNILILFFICLILYQILLATNLIGSGVFFVEGFDNQYQPYDDNTPGYNAILTQQNAGNIAYLKQQVDSLNELKPKVRDLDSNVATLQTQVNQLLTSQQDYAKKMTGGSPPVITGAVNEDTTKT